MNTAVREPLMSYDRTSLIGVEFQAWRVPTTRLDFQGDAKQFPFFGMVGDYLEDVFSNRCRALKESIAVIDADRGLQRYCCKHRGR
jgi:hypothetical protein